MSRRTSRRRQQSMNARRRAGQRAEPLLVWISSDQLKPKPLRVIRADPDTFPWYDGIGAGPVFRRNDGSAVGPMLIEHRQHGMGELTRWEIVEVRL